MKFKEISTGNTSIVRSNIPSGLFVLKHKDLDVAMVQIDLSTGVIEYVLDVFLPDELPPGYMGNPDKIIDWWKSRAIPDSRRGIQQVLNYLGEETNLSLMLSGYGLSLTGNSLFYNREIIPAGSDLLDIKVTSFSEKEVMMLRYVHERNLIDLNKLKGFSEEAEKLLTTYTDMPKERAKRIAGTIDQKIEYLRIFQDGKNIWKKEKYWQVIPWRK